MIVLYQPFQNPTIPCPAPSRLPPLSKVRCCRPKKFGRLPEGLPHQPFAPHQPFKNRTIPPTFRRVSVCVCLYGFASVQNSGHTRLRHPCLFMNALLALRPAKPLGVHFRHPCLACPSRCTQPLPPHNHCKRTTHPRSAPHSCHMNALPVSHHIASSAISAVASCNGFAWLTLSVHA